MADALGAAFSSGNAALFHGGDDRLCHDRNVLYLPTRTQSAAGGCAPLVVPQPVPRFARTTPVPGMHEFVTPEVWVASRLISGDPARRNQTAFVKLGHAHPRVETSK